MSLWIAGVLIAVLLAAIVVKNRAAVWPIIRAAFAATGGWGGAWKFCRNYLPFIILGALVIMAALWVYSFGESQRERAAAEEAKAPLTPQEVVSATWNQQTRVCGSRVSRIDLKNPVRLVYNPCRDLGLKSTGFVRAGLWPGSFTITEIQVQPPDATNNFRITWSVTGQEWCIPHDWFRTSEDNTRYDLETIRWVKPERPDQDFVFRFQWKQAPAALICFFPEVASGADVHCGRILNEIEGRCLDSRVFVFATGANNIPLPEESSYLLLAFSEDIDNTPAEIVAGTYWESRTNNLKNPGLALRIRCERPANVYLVVRPDQ